MMNSRDKEKNMEKDYTPITIKDAQLFKTNFSGKEIPPFNPAGRRNFCVFIDDIDFAEEMERKGWNIRWLEPKEEGDSRKAFLSVAVMFTNRPPKILMYTSKGETRIDEETVGMLDWAEKTKVDITINPRYWDDNGRQRIKAYLRTMLVWIYEDELEKEIDERYQNAPSSAMDAITDDAI